MGIFKKYADFINEWNLTGHWKDERGSLTADESRIQPQSDRFKEGWTCPVLQETSSEGKFLGKTVDTKEFLREANMTYESFSEKASKVLYMLVNSESVKKAFDKDHRYVCLGKLVFKVGDKFYSPSFKVPKGRGPVETRNYVWGVVLNNKAVTFFFRKDTWTKQELEDEALHDSRLEGHENTADDDYMRFVKTSFLYSPEFFVLIPDTKDWEEVAKKQIDTGKTLKDEYTPDDLLVKSLSWRNIFSKAQKATAVIDKGTVLLVNESLRAVTEFILQNPKDTNPSKVMLKLKGSDGKETIKSFGVGNIVAIMDKAESVDQVERKAGNLPLEGKLVREYKIDRIFKDSRSGKWTIQGALKDIVAFDEKTAKISRSEYPTT